jgi:DNA gyrase subunit A
VLRAPFAPFRTASTKAGRRYVRLTEGDRVVMACVLRDETSVMLASAEGRVLHFAIDDVNILAGVGKGVIGIKLDKNDLCIGGLALSKDQTTLTVETTGGKTMEFTRRYEVVGRGGKGFEAVKRTGFARIVPPPIKLTDWEAVEGGDAKPPRKDEGPKGLFE